MVLNRCKFIHLVLYVCGLSGFQCQYMADPETCPDYDEDFDRSYINGYPLKSLGEVTQLESERIENLDSETDLEFMERAREHLRSIGVETERVKKEDKVEEAPEWF